MSKISEIKAREILDSRGYPVLEVEIFLENGLSEKASVPNGASVGSYEAFELRDNDNARWNGKGLLKAIELVHTKITSFLQGKSILNPFKIDRILIDLDGTDRKLNYGANVLLAISIATFKLVSKLKNMPLYIYLGGVNAIHLPRPMVNIINGGVHSNNNLDFQEFMVVPIIKKEEKFRDGLEKIGKIFHQLKKNFSKNQLSIATGDEGGFAPNLKSNEEALDYILEAISEIGYTQEDVKIALDIASNELYDPKIKKYILKKTSGNEYNITEWVDFYKNLLKKYPIISLEDPMAENDYEGWIHITKSLSSSVQLVGDDLFVTNQNRFKLGIQKNIANAILLKPNQIGTITEMIQVFNLSKEYGYNSILSHRSGDTEEVFLADLAVGLNIKQIKIGSINRGERTAKYNQLLRIEEEILFNHF